MLQGRGDPGALRKAEDEAVLEALQRQEALGLDVVGDGEFRRFSFMGEVAGAADGFAFGELENPDWFTPEGTANPGSKAMIAASPLEPKRRIARDEASFLLDHARRPFKITLPSPLVVAQACWKPGVSDRAYPRRADLMWAVADILRGEIDALASEGVPYVQIDNPGLAYYLDPALRERSKEAGIEVDIPLEEALSADAHCLGNLPADGPVAGLHLCRGNWRSAWLAEGDLEPLAASLFALSRVDRFLLEYDTPRAGGFEPLRHVPEGKQVVLGLVSSKHGRLEDVDALARRVEEASRFVPAERLAVSPQCGFATSIPGNLLSEEAQWKKLELVVEVARKVWG